ncbi:hypothetical protein [Kiloniella majae]|uniref:hypothetical protein n=1 Tax=Kiloniella majae TaxID=1938558 RepID=UPI000A27903C|nr:hypothetical protein [Kiloniella majae]
MKYAIEKNGTLVSQISGWTLGLAKKCNLIGNKQAPQDLPFDLGDGATLRVVRTVKASPTPYQYVVDDGALVGNEWVISQTAKDKPTDQISTQKRLDINIEAARRIENIAPIWKQIRGSERAIELLEIKSTREWGEDEIVEADYLRAKRKEIEAIRSRSNALMLLPDEELIKVDVLDDMTWQTS